MKLSHLRQIVKYLHRFKKISAVHRVSDTIIKIVFDKRDAIYFNMSRSSSSMFKCEEYPRSKIYNAPFDVLIAKHFNRSNILNIQLVNDDKVIRIKTSITSAYKEEIAYIQIEFTGKYTNIIILNEQNIVLEALRHVDLYSSFREVRVGQILLDIPTAPFIAKEYPLENVAEFLYSVYSNEQNAKLENLKKQKVALLKKKLKKLQKLYDKLSSQDDLEELAQKNEYYGNLMLSNVDNFKPYSKKLLLNDYNGQTIELHIDKECSTPFMASSMFFSRSKKTKQKAKHLHIEEESLSSKIEHIKLFIHTVTMAKDIAKIELLFPKKVQSKKVQVNDSIESFWIEGYKVQLGKNEKGNIALLKNARAKDIWIHLKEQPSCHVIITTDKQSLPEKIIKSAARLCVDFTTTSQDKYLVDYTPRREVTIQHGANVLYNKYQTIEIDTRS